MEKKIICFEIENHSLQRLLDEIDVRIDSSDDQELKNSIIERNKKRDDIIQFYRQNNIEGFVPLKFNTFYYFSEIL